MRAKTGRSRLVFVHFPELPQVGASRILRCNLNLLTSVKVSGGFTGAVLLPMASTSRSRSMSRDRYSRDGRYRPRTSRSPPSPRSPTPRSAYSRSPVSDHRSSYNDRDPRGRSPPRSGSYRSRSYSRDRSPPQSSTRSESPYRPGASTKVSRPLGHVITFSAPCGSPLIRCRSWSSG
jgi:hypothetical protein